MKRGMPPIEEMYLLFNFFTYPKLELDRNSSDTSSFAYIFISFYPSPRPLYSRSSILDILNLEALRFSLSSSSSKIRIPFRLLPMLED
jgi:hypothetical protein